MGCGKRARGSTTYALKHLRVVPARIATEAARVTVYQLKYKYRKNILLTIYGTRIMAIGGEKQKNKRKALYLTPIFR